VRELAERLTVDAPTPYDKAQATAEYLQAMSYDLEIDPPPYDGDGVDYLLFTAERGYCDYFASALTVMLRTLGVPARLAVGYLPGEETEEGKYLVRDSDSHAWSEVYFPDYGWVPFEATPGTAAPPRSRPSPVGPGEYIPPIREEEEMYEEFDEDVPFLNLPVQPPPPSLTPLKVVGWLMLPVVLGLVMFLLWRRFMSPPSSADTAFRRMALLATLGGVSARPSQTPFEYAHRLGVWFPLHRGPIQAITDAYVRWRYGAKVPPVEEPEQMASAWLALRKELLLRIFRIGGRQWR
jgi:hypothetical protein